MKTRGSSVRGARSTRLRAWRLMRGFTHAEAAACVGVSAAYLRTIEMGVAPSDKVAERFAQAFGEPFSALLRDANMRDLPKLREEPAAS
jgi:transcriptional regulator with XRE-family HTH domain